MWTRDKMTFIRDFNQAIEMYLRPPSETLLPMLIFTFSDQTEQSSQFLQKLFSHDVLCSKKTYVLKINQPIEKDIEKVLYGILQKEQAIAKRQGIDANLAINKHIVEDVKVKCNKDMRAAIYFRKKFMGLPRL